MSLSIIFLHLIYFGYCQSSEELLESGMTKIRQKNYGSAMEDISKALKKDSLNPDAWFLSADLLMC